MQRKWWIVIILVIIALVICGYELFMTKKSAEVIVDNKKINVELALTETQRAKGLSGRDHLDADSGMLFVFPKADTYTFWMKDTKIPLDIIWINDNKVVEETTLEAETSQYTPTYTPKNKANYVFEVNAGFVNENNVKVGDKVEIKI